MFADTRSLIKVFEIQTADKSIVTLYYIPDYDEVNTVDNKQQILKYHLLRVLNPVTNQVKNYIIILTIDPEFKGSNKVNYIMIITLNNKNQTEKGYKLALKSTVAVGDFYRVYEEDLQNKKLLLEMRYILENYDLIKKYLDKAYSLVLSVKDKIQKISLWKVPKDIESKIKEIFQRR